MCSLIKQVKYVLSDLLLISSVHYLILSCNLNLGSLFLYMSSDTDQETVVGLDVGGAGAA
jgi:hypothetical protein